MGSRKRGIGGYPDCLRVHLCAGCAEPVRHMARCFPGKDGKYSFHYWKYKLAVRLSVGYDACRHGTVLGKSAFRLPETEGKNSCRAVYSRCISLCGNTGKRQRAVGNGDCSQLSVPDILQRHRGYGCFLGCFSDSGRGLADRGSVPGLLSAENSL